MASNRDVTTDEAQKLLAQDHLARAMGNDANLALLATAIAQVREGVLISDSAGIIQYVNPAFTRTTGYTAEEAVGQPSRLLKSNLQNPAYYKELWRTILAGKVWHGELINRRKDGTLYTEELSITPVRHSDGTIVNFIATFQDVTEHRITQKALQTSQKKLEHVQQIAALGSWELDVQAGIVRGSEAFFRIFACAPGTTTLSVSEWMETLSPTGHKDFHQTLKRKLHTNEPFDIEHQVLLRTGLTRVVRSRGQLVAAQGYESDRVVGTSQDITDFRLAHERLCQSEEKFRSLIANIPDVTWTAAADARTEYISPNVEGMIGFSSDEVCGQTNFWMEQTHPDDSRQVLQRFLQLFASGDPFDIEYRFKRKDGSWIWVHDRAYRTFEKNDVMRTAFSQTSPSAKRLKRNCSSKRRS